MSAGFVSQAKATRVGLGFRDLPWATIVGHPGVQTTEQVRDNFREHTLTEVIDNLTTSMAAQGGGEREPDPRDVVFRGGLTELNEYFIEREWSDGLPVVPPTRERIEAFLAHTRRSPDEVLGVLLPDNRVATVWNVAVNGVMAGCRPEYMPLLVSMIDAMCDPGYGNEHSGNTPGGDTLVILNGPVIQKLGFNYTQGVMRDGFQPNTSVGRFWRLYLRNVAGFLPHKTDKGCFGNTWRVVIAENDEVVRRIGWQPLSVDMGLGPDDSTVTIARYTGGGMVTSMSGNTPEKLLPYLADSIVNQTHWQISFTMGAAFGTLRPLALITPIVAETIAACGWSKDDVKRFLFEQCRIPAWQFERMLRDWKDHAIWNLAEQVAAGNMPRELYGTSDDPNRLVPIVWAPEHIMLVVTGDPLRNHGYTFGHNGRLGFPTTKKIDLQSSGAG
ncbi:UGSC family (seleno)protein [Xylophilus sp. GOD-11R]|uniref:UGSC family (seleno)protein n=1 Tax=Xylophilus sp. GOD-11R TaxID=3089814 RepID=UPI00298C1152|nr:UGSC family (seleno)protein [Xylophilus sp. GOD-11R]WPB55921.1 UGSC family (seleno)protein [Xylophilus sp. GOD-11R]